MPAPRRDLYLVVLLLALAAVAVAGKAVQKFSGPPPKNFSGRL